MSIQTMRERASARILKEQGFTPKEYVDMYPPAKITLPRNFMPEHPFDNGEMTVRDEMLLPHPRSPEAVEAMNAEYYRYISFLDLQIGRILDALAASPYAANTYVVFSADSGVARGSHGLIGKQNLYEHSVRVLLIIAGPGIPAGAQTAAMCFLYDVLPTLGKLCGVTNPEPSEAREFSTTLRDPKELAPYLLEPMSPGWKSVYGLPLIGPR
jgi:arylsulfatase A-like enzyme